MNMDEYQPAESPSAVTQNSDLGQDESGRNDADLNDADSGKLAQHWLGAAPRPQRDLWPDIAARIQDAAHPQAASRVAPSSRFSKAARALRWGGPVVGLAATLVIVVTMSAGDPRGFAVNGATADAVGFDADDQRGVAPSSASANTAFNSDRLVLSSEAQMVGHSAALMERKNWIAPPGHHLRTVGFAGGVLAGSAGPLPVMSVASSGEAVQANWMTSNSSNASYALHPETRALMRANLKIVSTAEVQVQRALRQDPDDAYLRNLLDSTRRQKEALRDALGQ